MNMLEVGLLCAGVLLGPVAARTVVHEVRHWKHARNLIRVTQAEYEPPRRDSYGSMNLAEEQRWRAGEPVPLPRAPYWPPADDGQTLYPLPWPRLEGDWLPAPPREMPWPAEPTVAEVAASRALHGYIPELDTDAGEVMPFEAVDAPARPAGHVSSGPGVVPQESSPGPDPLWEYHADHPADLPERVSLPRVELGPRAQAVLDRYQARHQERWAFTAPPGIGALA